TKVSVLDQRHSASSRSLSASRTWKTSASDRDGSAGSQSTRIELPGFQQQAMSSGNQWVLPVWMLPRELTNWKCKHDRGGERAWPQNGQTRSVTSPRTGLPSTTKRALRVAHHQPPTPTKPPPT